MTSKDPNHLERSTREHVHLLCSRFRAAMGGSHYLTVACTWRDGAAQAKALAEGRSTKGPGASKHNILAADGSKRSCACDLLVTEASTGRTLECSTPSEFALYQAAGEIWESFGGRWGGRWRRLCDPGHFEAPGKQADLAAGGEPKWAK